MVINNESKTERKPFPVLNEKNRSENYRSHFPYDLLFPSTATTSKVILGSKQNQRSESSNIIMPEIETMIPHLFASSFPSSSSYPSSLKFHLPLLSYSPSYPATNEGCLKHLPLALSPALNHKEKTKNKQGENAMVKFAISGFSAVFFEFCIGHGLEFFKIAKQTSLDKTYLDILKEITHSKGIYGIWVGIFSFL